MAISYFNFASATLTTSAATYYTMPAQPSTAFLQNGRVRFTNITNTTATVTFYAVPLAGTAGGTNTVLYQVSVPGNQYVDTYTTVLTPGATLQALSGTASAITMLCLGGTINS